MVLSNPHSLELQQPVLFLSRRKSVATGLASYNGPNGYESIDYAAMAYEVLPFKMFVLKIKVRNTKCTTCLYLQRTMLSKPVSPGSIDDL